MHALSRCVINIAFHNTVSKTKTFQRLIYLRTLKALCEQIPDEFRNLWRPLLLAFLVMTQKSVDTVSLESLLLLTLDGAQK